MLRKDRVRFAFGSKFRCTIWISCALTLLLLTAPVGANGDEPAVKRRWLSGRVTGSGWLARVAGSLQTPRGGGAGTTDPNRPTIEEIGLDRPKGLGIGDLQLTLLRDHELHLRVEWAHVSGRSLLQDDLTSQGAFFAAGSVVDSQLDTKFGRLGYRAHWLPLKWPSGSAAPEIGLAVVNFHYQLESLVAVQAVDREYSWEFPYLGFFAQHRISDRLGFEAEIAGMAGINGVTFAAMDLRALYTFWQHGSFKARTMVGLAGTWLRRKDDQQPEHNDPNLRYGAFSDAPWAGFHFGLRADF
jgi:hypothetical protein